MAGINYNPTPNYHYNYGSNSTGAKKSTNVQTPTSAAVNVTPDAAQAARDQRKQELLDAINEIRSICCGLFDTMVGSAQRALDSAIAHLYDIKQTLAPRFDPFSTVPYSQDFIEKKYTQADLENAQKAVAEAQKAYDAAVKVYDEKTKFYESEMNKLIAELDALENELPFFDYGPSVTGIPWNGYGLGTLGSPTQTQGSVPDPYATPVP